MKELADERRILNGVEITPEGNKMHYFKRVLINYKDPKGPRDVTSFDEIKEEIDRLDPEEALCYFHIDHRKVNYLRLRLWSLLPEKLNLEL